MKKVLRWCMWETENEFKTCGYFCVMFFCYGIVEFLYGKKEVSLMVVLEMFVLNYVISTVQKIVLDDENTYDRKRYYLRATLLLMGSFVVTVITCHGFQWFRGRGIYAEAFMYLCMISAYLFVWFIERIQKSYDTKLLNEQLSSYKERDNKED